jgi:hypothetical protein
MSRRGQIKQIAKAVAPIIIDALVLMTRVYLWRATAVNEFSSGAICSIESIGGEWNCARHTLSGKLFERHPSED